MLALHPLLLPFAIAHAALDPIAARPDATVDLASEAGASLVRADWRWKDATFVPLDGRAVGPDLRPSGVPNRTLDVSPHAEAIGFDDSGWERVTPAGLEARRGDGHVSFGWYRTRITVPERVGDLPTAGTTVVFELVVDDYAEVWVDGKLPLVLGQTGGPVVAGFNAPNRVVLTRDARPGQTIQLAVFAMNGPISASPANFIWIRSVGLDLYKPAPPPTASQATIERLDPTLAAIVPADARVEKLADGFLFTEGPVWHPDGYLLFSDPNANVIYRWSEVGGVQIYRAKSGYHGADVARYHQPGSNGLTLDREGRLTVDQHGERRVIRIEKTGAITVLADRYQGKRLNSPNDLVYRSDGGLYFTDPPFGLPGVFADPARELPYSGVFFWKDGKLALVAKDLTGPNGLALSPDEKLLYVTDWDEQKKVVTRYRVSPDGTLGAGETFFDMTAAPGAEALDGMKVDQRGNLYVSGPGGVWIISPAGKHLGTLHVAELPANMAWGDADGKTLYLTARTGLYRIRLSIPGIRP